MDKEELSKDIALFLNEVACDIADANANNILEQEIGKIYEKIVKKRNKLLLASILVV